MTELPRPDGSVQARSTESQQGAPSERFQFGGRNLLVSTSVGIGIVGVIVATLLWAQWGFVVFAALFLALGVRELVIVMLSQSAKPLGAILLLATPTLFIGTYAVGQRYSGLSHPLAALLGGLCFTTVALLSWRLLGPVDNYTTDLAKAVLILGYVPLLGSSIVLMLLGTHPMARVMMTLLCVVASDTGAFLVGVLAGRRPGGNHKMAPRISPAKSWEGFAGGVLLSAVVGLIIGVMAFKEPWWEGMLIGTALALAAVLGDLVESMVKRSHGIKDMGHLIPGHGGAMDRLDSVLLAAPVGWALMYLLIR
ncbi:MAG: phosphatidate cytidylyltransferase [Propionibacteriaceae bacterium]|nr:phosphatidate cytidylyltransferase [Propionibacteriaceae bacterium]